ncbi:enoyl-CoA hydratase-related protein [Nocardioides acrostichi]|uniref:Enoyl-CoA hydratase/isomerase family protein n=1 Tax=Nocardioides acrostichi TaxID=2784339 RepID=A0A930UZB2_9ACTN|nr:enoyl-CoA hydratase-related protein [Nocardioides acrostichi]MBF4160800.1 enoyl-CoA hydratase/isomerase family protein [Nocardioides acrostichi]
MVHVEARAAGRVSVFRLDRPRARNAIDGETAAALESWVRGLDADPEIWMGVLSASGPVFCAGADLKEISAGRLDSLSTAAGGFGGITRLARETPLVAAVDGPALAGGCELALACDLIVASEQASFGIPEVKRSLIAGGGGLIRLPSLLPQRIAMELALTGSPIDARRAYDLGLVNRLVGDGDAEAGAVRLAEEICRNAPLAVRASRRLVVEASTVDHERLWELSDAASRAIELTADFAEGPRAFMEKREPVWTGR